MLYKDAGVDIEKADELVRFLAGKNPFIGGFAGGLPVGFIKEYQDPVLFAATDGIGTKILLAQQTGIFEGLGYDLVGMCVNDLVTVNAKPLFFLDYYAVEKLDLDLSKNLLQSVINALEEIDCPLIGGETAELPGMVKGFDVAGFAVGVAEKHAVPKACDVKAGMRLIGLKSSGPHSNGYSLIRKAFGPDMPQDVAEKLMAPTRLYVKQTLRAFEMGAVAAAHITGGGLPGNLIRVLPGDLRAVVRLPEIPEVFALIAEAGQVPLDEMIRVFNMGWGMVLIVPEENADHLCRELSGVDIGWIESGGRAVEVEVKGA